jgi:hypothetical protein
MSLSRIFLKNLSIDHLVKIKKKKERSYTLTYSAAEYAHKYKCTTHQNSINPCSKSERRREGERKRESLTQISERRALEDENRYNYIKFCYTLVSI